MIDILFIWEEVLCVKEATGELSMTTITIIAVIAIAGIVTMVAPMVKNFINQSWNNLAHTSPS